MFELQQHASGDSSIRFSTGHTLLTLAPWPRVSAPLEVFNRALSENFRPERPVVD